MKGLIRAVCVCPRSGGGVHPVLPQAHERHRGDTLQHELHQQQPGNTHRPTVQPQRGRRHPGQEGQVQKVTRVRLWLIGSLLQINFRSILD